MWGQQGMVSTVADCQANAWSKESRQCSDPARCCRKWWCRSFWTFSKAAGSLGFYLKDSDFFRSVFSFFLFFFFCSFLQHSINQTKCVCRLDPTPGLLVYNCSGCSSARPQNLFFFFFFIFISWRLITLQYCSGFCHTLTWISHGFTCVPHPEPPSHLPIRPQNLDEAWPVLRSVGSSPHLT